MRHKILALSVILIMAAGISISAAAQTVTGTLEGLVTDSTGAVIPNAKVVVVGEDTGLLREAATNAEGRYLLTFLPIGHYGITVSAGGFMKMKRAGVEVSLNSTTPADFKLSVSATAEVVNVTGEAPLINTAGSDIKDTFDERIIQDRPLPSRNILTLAETVPGFQDNAVSGQNNPTLSSGSSANFNGVGTRGTTFQINGVNNDDSSENQNRQNVNVSSVAQVQVLTNNYSAEFGRGYGAVMLVQTKQGTNRYHGEAFLYEINSPLGFANSYYGNYSGTALASWRRHDYGGVIGGPIVKDKLFFFGSYEGIRNGGGRMSTYSVLLPNERTAAASVTGAADRAFIQSMIDRFPSVTGSNVPNLCPGPAAVKGAIDGQTYQLTPPCRVYRMPIKYSYPAEDVSGRIDWNINMQNTFTGRYQWSRQITDPGTDWIKGQAVGYHNTQQNVGLTLTHVFSTRQIGELRLALGRRATQANVAAGNDTPIFRFGGTYGSIIGNAGNFPILRYQTDWQFVYNHSLEATSKLRLRFGTDIRPSQLNDLSDNYTRGYWSMGSQGWVQTAAGNNFEYRDGYYNFLRGIMTGGSFSKGYGPARLGNRIKEFNFYAQADYRVTQSLTLNLGSRYEYVRAPREVNHKVDYGYGDTHAFQPRIGFAYSPQWNSGFLAKLSGGPGASVVRGGFGLFHGRWFQSAFSQGGASIRFNPPDAAYIGFTMTNATSIGDPSGGFVFSPGPATGRVSLALIDPNLTLPYAEQWNFTIERQLPGSMAVTAAYVGNRGIGLPFYNMVNRARFPFTAPPANQWSPADQANGTAAKWAGVTFDCVDPNLASTAPIKDPITGHQCISLGQTYAAYRRPDARYGANFLIRNGSWSYYNALQVLLAKKPSHGLNFQAAYTYGKALDTGSELTNTVIDFNYPYLEGDSARSMKGFSLFDTRHRFTFTYGYDLPWFKNQPGLLGRALGGWTLSGTFLYATGNPFTVTTGYDLNADGLTNDRPDVVDASVYGTSVNNGRYVPGTKNTVSMSQIPYTAFYPNYSMTLASYGSAFRPGIDQRGNEYRNGFRSAGRNNWDMSLSKNVKIAEGHSLVLRWDVYNVMNHPQFNVPSTRSVTSTDFLRIDSQRDNRGFFTDGFGGARFMQLALRYKF